MLEVLSETINAVAVRLSQEVYILLVVSSNILGLKWSWRCVRCAEEMRCGSLGTLEFIICSGIVTFSVIDLHTLHMRCS